MQRNPRSFNLQEAQELLPLLENVLKRLDSKMKEFEKLQDHILMEDLLHQADGRSNRDGLEEDQKRLDQSMEAWSEEILEINSLGCKVCDLVKGWIDFPAQHEGNSIFYVWKRGEAQIRFYRNVQDKTKLLPL